MLSLLLTMSFLFLFLDSTPPTVVDKKRKYDQVDQDDKNMNNKQTVDQSEQESTGGWNDWSKASFGGDQEQKSKFLRLLGAKKSSANKDEGNKKKTGLFGSLKSAIDEDEGQRISNQLEKQFQDGLQFRKQQQMGRRGGLGFN
ncbi:uncharacterized protein BX664DRAFT_202770 [Halteromyces radiatus]|uniref:uncharacterized protein n=1 Tax=Halteromyces radiatus TaxID=101107 RepID=UPI00221F8C41|nr:uncharacterized protein BX664DRAFT_202770 [Halteromyces radiatus]KAI8079805.1 hypothetical protein BX664DRAFT_202770 [Halteromyces radiatus]